MKGKPRNKVIDPKLFETRASQMLLIPTDIEGLPRNRIMSAFMKVHPDEPQPTYNIYDVARIFFGAERKFVYNICLSESWEKLSTHALAVTPYKGDVRWTLDEVERLIHILYDLKRISYARQVIALHIVAWTAKAYGLYV